MNAEIKTLPGSPALGLFSRLLIIAGVLVCVAVPAIAAVSWFGWVDYRLGLLAFAVCLVSSIGAHIVGEYPEGDQFVMVRMASSMMARTLLPIFVCLFAKFSSVIPFEPGFVLLVFLFYLVGLAVDVKLQAARLKNV